jgi:threonine dehydrogenase-like Zn-dependent dehydrogenase
VETIPDPQIVNPHDAIVEVTSTAICGSDLHLYDGYIPTMKKGDVLGHEFMGIVVDVGREVQSVRVGDRVVVPFTIACGRCWFCQKELWSLCDNTNPNASMAEAAYGYSPSGLFGYSHMLGGYAGGQAELVRVPFADVGCLKIEDPAISDEKVLFLTDIFPTGYMAAENCNIHGGDVIAVFGCGPVGQMAIRSAFLLGAERVLAIDDVPERLEMARAGGATAIDHREVSVLEVLKDITAGRGPDACIDAVGMEAHGFGPADMTQWYDKAKQALRLETDRPTALRAAIMACRKGGTLSAPGVYGGLLDKVPFGAAFGKGLTLRMGQTHMHRYMRPLLERIQAGEIDPSFVITHRLSLEDAPQAYGTFQRKEDGCIKVVLQP